MAVSTRRLARSGPGGVTSTTRTASSAVISSTIGYWIEIDAPHWRQRPRKASQLTTGTLSNQARRLPHFGQRDGGLTSEPPLGSR